jgi:hypothetical protein
MKIEKIYFSRLRNEAHYQFLLLLRKLFAAHSDVEAIVAPLRSNFDDLLSTEGKLVDAVRGSKFTEKLKLADERVDKAITGINNTIEAGLHHYDLQVEDAAKVLAIRMKAFRGEIEKKAYEEESAAVKILVKDFLLVYTEQVTLLNLTGWVTEVGAAQKAFEELFIERNAELAARTDQTLVEVRHEIETVYRGMIDLISASILINGSSEVETFVEQLNRQVAYFNEHAHHQKKHDLKDAFVENIPDQPFEGEPITYLPTVRYEDKKLVFARDYDLLYKDNEVPGTATIIIRGKGGYTGKTEVRFNIIA